MSTFTSEGAARQLAAFEKVIAEHNAAMAGLIRGGTRESYSAAQTHLARAQAAVQQAHREIAATLADPRYPTAGKQQLVRDLVDAARSAVNDAVEDARTATLVLEAELREQAKPRMPANRADRDAAERRLTALLDRTPQADMSRMVRELAARGDDVAAVLHTQYGKDLVTLKDAQIGASLNQLVEAETVAGAASSDNPDRQRAAQALGQLGKLKGVPAALVQAMGHLAEDAPAYADRAAMAEAAATNRAAYAAGVAAGRSQAELVRSIGPDAA